MWATSKIVACVTIVSLITVILWVFVVSNGTKKKITATEPLAESTIQRVAIFFRHGERAPAINSSVMNITSPIWPEGYGELTKIGKEHSYNLGKRLRNRYSHVLSPYYSSRNVTVLSTNMDRAIVSTSLVLGGMYPPSGYQVWNEKLLWNPIAVHIDKSLLNYFKCERFVYEYLKHKPVETAKRLRDFQLSLKNQYIAIPALEDDIYFVYDALSSLDCNGIKLGSWAKDLLRTCSNLMAEWMSLITSRTHVQKQLCSLFSDHLLSFIDSNKKVFVYGNHDISLFMLAGTLGMTLEAFPLPTATIAVELHTKNDEQFVTAFYISGYNVPMIPVRMACGNECTLAAFRQMLIDLQPDNYDQLCHSMPETMSSFELEHYMTFFDVTKNKKWGGLAT